MSKVVKATLAAQKLVFLAGEARLPSYGALRLLGGGGGDYEGRDANDGGVEFHLEDIVEALLSVK